MSLAMMMAGVIAAGPCVEDPLPSESIVREILNMDDNLGGKEEALIRVGERAFPVYLRILSSKDVTTSEIAGIFSFVSIAKGDRSRFLEPAVTGLTHRHVSVRRASLDLLGRIGTAADSAPVVALLSDEDWTISVAAAKTLAAIGDKRTLVAMTAWINSSAPRKERNEKFDASFRKDVAKYRDDLKARLERVDAPGK